MNEVTFLLFLKFYFSVKAIDFIFNALGSLLIRPILKNLLDRKDKIVIDAVNKAIKDSNKK